MSRHKAGAPEPSPIRHYLIVQQYGVIHERRDLHVTRHRDVWSARVDCATLIEKLAGSSVSVENDQLGMQNLEVDDRS